MKCRKCGREINNSKFCPYCGNCTDNPNTNYLLIGILLIIFFPFLGIIYCAVMSSRDSRLMKVIMWYGISVAVIVVLFLLFVFAILSSLSERSDENSYETICYDYCKSSFTIEGNTCICNDGRTYELYSEEDKKDNTEPKENDDDEYFEEYNVTTEFNKEEWMNLVNSDYYVINVIAASWCPHCTNFKPVIITAAKESKIKLYFIETDKLSEEDKNAYVNTYNLENYKGGYPYTFITRKGKVLTEHAGEMSLDETLEFINSVKKNYM